MTAAIDYRAKKLAPELLPLLTLQDGGHDKRTDGLCVMEAAAWLAGEPHSATPSCASPLVTRFAQRINDRFDQTTRDALRDRLPLIVGSRSTSDVERKRSLEFVYLFATLNFARALEFLAGVERVAKYRDRLLAGAATLRALKRDDEPNKWRADAQQARATVQEVRREFPAYAYAYAILDASRRAEFKAQRAKDALAILDAILAIRE